MRGHITMLLFNPKNPAHSINDITERGLRFPQFSSDLDLDAGEYGHALANHIGRDFDLSPAAKIGPSLGRGVQGTGRIEDYFIRGSADNFTGPTHPGVDAEKAFLGCQGFKDFSDTFGFAHADIIT